MNVWKVEEGNSILMYFQNKRSLSKISYRGKTSAAQSSANMRSPSFTLINETDSHNKMEKLELQLNDGDVVS